jgi:hypothetical protein
LQEHNALTSLQSNARRKGRRRTLTAATTEYFKVFHGPDVADFDKVSRRVNVNLFHVSTICRLKIVEVVGCCIFYELNIMRSTEKRFLMLNDIYSVVEFFNRF